MISVILFVVLFGVLVFIHELGHFLMAKFFGICVERFSIGFGWRLFGKQVGETDYQLAAIPLGGYVKMLGDEPGKEVPPELAARSYMAQPARRRMAVVFAGPFVNVLFPLLLYIVIYLVGIQRPDTFVGYVDPASPAKQAGLEVGDRILSISSKPVKKFSEIEEIFRKNPGVDLNVVVERYGEKKDLIARPEPRDLPNKFGELTKQGFLGIGSAFVAAKIAVPFEKSVAYKAGLRTGDRVVKICGSDILAFSELERAYSNCRSKPVAVEAVRGDSKLSIELPRRSGLSDIESLGVRNYSVIISDVKPSTPAESAGIKPGDLVVSIEGKPVSELRDISDRIKSSGGKRLSIIIRRDGQNIPIKVTPIKSEFVDPLLGKDSTLGKESFYNIGVILGNGIIQSSFMTERYLNPITLISHAVKDTAYLAYVTVAGLYKLILGQLSLKLLGGPIMIYKFAGQSYQLAGGGLQGVLNFLNMMALLSMSLGVINLFPIPVLDGGHILFYAIEVIRRRPLPSRVVDVAQQVGFVILMALLCLVFYNDIARWNYVEKFIGLFK